MNLGVFIISCLPENIEKANIRRNVLPKTEQWVRKRQLPYHTIRQNYKDTDTFFEKSNYCLTIPPVGAARARNYLLDIFYQSSFDWGLFLDDDTVVKSDNDSFSFLESDKIDCFIPINPMHHWCYPGYYSSLLKDNWVCHKTIELKGSAFFLKNLNKAYNKQLFFDTDIDVLEDTEFAIRINENHLSTYRIDNVAISERCLETSTIYDIHTSDRSVRNKACFDLLQPRIDKLSIQNTILLSPKQQSI